MCSFLLRASEYSSWDNWRDVLRGTVWEFRHRRDWRHGHGSGESSDREYSESFTVNQDVCGNFLFYYKSLQITLRAFKVQPVDYVITNYKFVSESGLCKLIVLSSRANTIQTQIQIQMQFVLPSWHKVGQQSYKYSPCSEYFSGTGAGLKQRPVATCRCPPAGQRTR